MIAIGLIIILLLILVSVIGFMYIILYLNLFALGYSVKEYFCFIFSRYECILGILGFFVVTFTIFYKGDKIMTLDEKISKLRNTAQ